MVVHKYKHSTFGETKRLLASDDNLLEPILFREKLYVFDENGKRIGRFSLNIDQKDSKGDAQNSLYVHISNRAYVNNRLSESVVTGTVTSKLRTMEEIRYEGTDLNNFGMHERCMFLLREATKYYLSVTNSIDDHKTQSQGTISFVDALVRKFSGLIGECANAVLLRKLARKGYEGILSLRALLSNGKRCRNYYVTKLSEQMVNGNRMQVLIVYRNITNHKKCNVTMTMALTRAGQLIYLFWSNTKCFLHIDPDVFLNTRRFTYGEPPLYTHWHSDIELYSLYLDRVDMQFIKFRSFKYRNQALRRILGDFLMYLLILKPPDIICYAIEFFTSFDKRYIRKCTSKETPIPEKTESVFSEEDYKDDGIRSWMESPLFYGEP